MAAVFAVNRHAEDLGIEFLRALDVLAMQYDVVDPARLNHRQHLPIARARFRCRRCPTRGRLAGISFAAASADVQRDANCSFGKFQLPPRTSARSDSLYLAPKGSAEFSVAVDIGA